MQELFHTMAQTYLASIPYPHLNPIIVKFGPVAIRWYGMAYLTGFLLGFLCLRRMIQRGVLRLTQDQLADLVGWLVAGVMVGGRAGWWIFYHRPDPRLVSHWYDPIAVWQGGMSFHGGLAGVCIAIAIWCRVMKAPGWNIADCSALVAPIGLFLGRLANFVNAELVGRPTDLPWGVVFPGRLEARHPSQIYEAILEGPMLFLVVWIFRRFTNPREGQTASIFLIAYGIFRFAVEFTREPDVQLGFIAFGWLTMGQILSLALSLVGVAAFWVTRRQPLANSLIQPPAVAPVAAIK